MTRSRVSFREPQPVPLTRFVLMVVACACILAAVNASAQLANNQTSGSDNFSSQLNDTSGAT